MFSPPLHCRLADPMSLWNYRKVVPWNRSNSKYTYMPMYQYEALNGLRQLFSVDYCGKFIMTILNAMGGTLPQSHRQMSALSGRFVSFFYGQCNVIWIVVPESHISCTSTSAAVCCGCKITHAEEPLSHQRSSGAELPRHRSFDHHILETSNGHHRMSRSAAVTISQTPNTASYVNDDSNGLLRTFTSFLRRRHIESSTLLRDTSFCRRLLFDYVHIHKVKHRARENAKPPLARCNGKRGLLEVLWLGRRHRIPSLMNCSCVFFLSYRIMLSFVAG